MRNQTVKFGKLRLARFDRRRRVGYAWTAGRPYVRRVGFRAITPV